jgi:hypothetical protein
LSGVAAWIASSKGRSGIGVFFLSVLLSPLVGLIVALALQSSAQVEEGKARSGTSNEFRKCPFCAEVIRREAVKCRYCQSDLQTASTERLSSDALKELGFERITEWTLDGDRLQLSSLIWGEREGWLYAFVVAGNTTYVNAADGALSSHLEGYANNSNERIGRIRDAIKSDLSHGRQVEIYGRREPDRKARTENKRRILQMYNAVATSTETALLASH